MDKPLLEVSVSMRIGRPIDVVRRHFMDVDHHVKHLVHPGVEFTPVAQSEDECRFRKTIRIAGLPVADEVVLRRQPDGSVTEDSIAGPSKGMRLTSRFREDEPDQTLTTLTVEMPVPGVKRLLAPLLRRMVLRRLTTALDEDRRDLENGRYPD